MVATRSSQSLSSPALRRRRSARGTFAENLVETPSPAAALAAERPDETPRKRRRSSTSITRVEETSAKRPKRKKQLSEITRQEHAALMRIDTLNTELETSYNDSRHGTIAILLRDTKGNFDSPTVYEDFCERCKFPHWVTIAQRELVLHAMSCVLLGRKRPGAMLTREVQEELKNLVTKLTEEMNLLNA